MVGVRLSKAVRDQLHIELGEWSLSPDGDFIGGGTRFYIYGMSERIPGAPIAYVGQTRLGLYRRFLTHVYNASRRRVPIEFWIWQLLMEGRLPRMEVLEIVDTPERLRCQERYWIQKLDPRLNVNGRTPLFAQPIPAINGIMEDFSNGVSHRLVRR